MKETKQMKKLMIAAAAAAMIGGAYANGQFYTFSATFKTTKMAKFSGKSSYCGSQYYRTQTTKKFAGAIWGCNCETILVGNEAGWQPNEVTEEFSAALWDVTDKAPIYLNTFKWAFIQRIDKKGNKVEGLWYLDGAFMDAEKGAKGKVKYVRGGNFRFNGAGFGNVKVVSCNSYADEEDAINGGLNYVEKMSGNLVGVLPATYGEYQKCSWCKTEKIVKQYTAWELCDCCRLNKKGTAYDLFCEISANEDKTAASGTWTIKYNASAAKKLLKLDPTNGDTALDAYKFPTYAKDLLVWLAL